MEKLNNIQKSRLLSIYNDDNVIGKSQTNELEKSQGGGGNLVEKKVQIHKKDGTTFYAIRWVDPTTEQSHDIQHPKYQHTDINGTTQEDKIHSVVHHTTMSVNDKVRKLVGLGIHDKKQLSELSGHKYPSDIPTLVKKETGVDLKSHTPTTSLPIHKDPSNPVNFTSHEGQVLAISKIAELHGSKEAFKRQKEIATQVQKDLNLTVDDKWDSYSTDLSMLLDGELGLRAVMGYGTGGAGKFQSIESMVLTPYGFKRMGDIKKGDRVWCPDGTESLVLEIFPQGVQPIYKVTLKDGRTTTSGMDHLWKVKDRTIDYSWKVLQLKNIVEKGLKLKNQNEYSFGVPLIRVPFEHKSKNNTKVPIQPWVMGFLLGDGCWSQPSSTTFSVGERDREFIVNKLTEHLGSECVIHRENLTIDYRIVSATTKYLKDSKFRTNFSKAIKELELRGTKSNTKFIPELYFNLSSEMKLELVRGLMDSDGYVSDEGFCTYTSVSKQLAEDFLKLVRSLGARFASIGEHNDNVENSTGQVYYDVNFMMQNGTSPVSLPFKLDRIQDKEFPIDSLSITSVEYIGDMEAQCILIDHPDHLYVTDDFIVTHNTHQLESIIIPEKKLIEYDPEMDMEPGGDEYDYVKIGGKIGSREVQRKMYEHQNKVLIFDDCDSMWNDDGLINVLKNALDTSGRGKVQWAIRLPETAKDKGDEVPSSFVFSGRMIFITNLTKQELVDRGAAAVVESRCASTDLSMNLEQTLERLDKISPHLKLKDENRNDITDLQEEDKTSALKAFKEMSHLGRIDQVNTRVLTQIVAKARYARRTLGLTGEAKHDFLKKQLAKQFGF